jgi:parallel beta-helix repeat protein
MGITLHPSRIASDDPRSFGATGDGVTDDTAAFQAALNAGGEVLVRPGTYVVTGLSVPSGVVFRGTPGAVLKHKAAAAGAMITVADASVRACLVGLTLDGNSPNQTANVSPLQIGGVGTRILGLNVYDAKYDGMLIRPNASRVLVDGCHVYELNAANATGRYGITIGGSSGADAPHQITLSNNTVRRSTDGGLGIVGIGIDVVIEGNVVTDTVSGDAIAAYNRSNLRVVIANNVGDTLGNNGIHVGGSDIIVTGNVMRAITFQGIVVASDPNSDPTASVGATVAGNLVDDTDGVTSGAGIKVQRYSHVTVSGNTVLNANTHGIHLSDCIEAAVNGNTVRDAAAQGCRVEGTVRASVGGNVIASATGDGLRVLQFTRVDATVVQSEAVTVVGNTITDNGGWGVQSMNSSDRVLLASNILRGNVSGAQTLVGANNSLGTNIT